MDQRRSPLLFFAISFGFLLLYMNVILPWIAPPPPPQEVAEEEGGEQPPEDEPDASTKKDDPLEAPRPKPPVAELQRHPEQVVTLGSLESDSGFFLQVDVSSLGASIEAVRLNGRKFKELTDRNKALAVIESVDENPLNTLMTGIEQLDTVVEDRLGVDLGHVHWELVDSTEAAGHEEFLSEVTFRYEVPGEPLRVTKRFRLPVLDSVDEESRKTDPAGYLIDFDLTIENVGEETEDVTYELLGPVGVRLENEENTRKYRDVRGGFLAADGDLEEVTVTAAEVVEDDAQQKGKIYRDPVRYIGVDVQYFAALLSPVADQLDDDYLDKVRPVLIEKGTEEEYSDISVKLTSREFELKPGESVTHQYQLYAGPKREVLLASVGAESVMNYGFFGIIARLMLTILQTLHNYLALPYALAIICLTIIVRLALFPLSRKQAVGAAKMKELQPEMKALQERYKDNREKLAQEQMALFRKHNYNPLSGCLPVVMQIPIFFGLYSALYASVDLRMADFLWIDNLAAPDQLFRMSVRLPFLGQDFNLLPLLTVVLFIVQQRMFMPPATSPEQAMQYKMMNFMMVAMGFLFWKVPAGLCLYFIASSLWSIGERKLLADTNTAAATGDGQVIDVVPRQENQATRVRRSDKKRSGSGKRKKK